MKHNPLRPSLEEYFQSLPAFMQESIRQSGIDFSTVDALEAFVNNLSKS